ncbi:hypothetical protein PR048_014035 [Dryococelus australis]|uniref:Uncharacterized protein n=1 Tax=Dryococelus australis TaxID=614101 RepID=A0ABQ9HTW3_9NEOP|nr:hypothetical protein PR048_014035 [Dryococelus australis]
MQDYYQQCGILQSISYSRPLASHTGEPGSIPGLVAHVASHVVIAPDDDADGRALPRYDYTARRSLKVAIYRLEDSANVKRLQLLLSTVYSWKTAIGWLFAKEKGRKGERKRDKKKEREKRFRRLLTSRSSEPMRVIEVNMEWRQNEGAGETGAPRENPPTNGIVRHDSQLASSLAAHNQSPCPNIELLFCQHVQRKRRGLALRLEHCLKAVHDKGGSRAGFMIPRREQRLVEFPADSARPASALKLENRAPVQWRVVECCKVSWRLLTAVHSRCTRQERESAVQPGESECIPTTHKRAIRDLLHASCGGSSRLPGTVFPTLRQRNAGAIRVRLPRVSSAPSPLSATTCTGVQGSRLAACSYETSSAAPELRGGGKREILEKTRRPMASSGTVPTCENPFTRSGIEPGSPW